jgi:hypothetical protein
MRCVPGPGSSTLAAPQSRVLGGRGTLDAVLLAPESSRASIVDGLLRSGFARAPFGWLETTLMRKIELADHRFPARRSTELTQPVVLLGSYRRRNSVRASWFSCRASHSRPSASSRSISRHTRRYWRISRLNPLSHPTRSHS